MVNGWFGARWFGILGLPQSNNPFHEGIPGIQTTNPNHQLYNHWLTKHLPQKGNNRLPNRTFSSSKKSLRFIFQLYFRQTCHSPQLSISGLASFFFINLFLLPLFLKLRFVWIREKNRSKVVAPKNPYGNRSWKPAKIKKTIRIRVPSDALSPPSE